MTGLFKYAFRIIDEVSVVGLEEDDENIFDAETCGEVDGVTKSTISVLRCMTISQKRNDLHEKCVLVYLHEHFFTSTENVVV